MHAHFFRYIACARESLCPNLILLARKVPPDSNFVLLLENDMATHQSLRSEAMCSQARGEHTPQPQSPITFPLLRLPPSFSKANGHIPHHVKPHRGVGFQFPLTSFKSSAAADSKEGSGEEGAAIERWGRRWGSQKRKRKERRVNSALPCFKRDLRSPTWPASPYPLNSAHRQTWKQRW